MEGVSWPHDDGIVLQMIIRDRMVHRILIDTGASVDLLSYQAFKQFGLGDESLIPDGTNLYGFLGATTKIEGSIKMPVTAGEYPNEVTVDVNFMVVRMVSAFNAILGRPALNALGVIVSTKHLKIKFQTPNGVGECRTNQKKSRECYASFVKQKNDCGGMALTIAIPDYRDKLVMR
ncbi:uncharacterized protein LOC122643243 [Telopea speciosissima]|uniref:uncharacterized protein LOC122643243 n=1 Tax=Telopea speciosissima TaxID=54955 RepID=UPI001CC35E42|nr:uncharacterized protein LOC122643243 [Telopea speciosissima]